MDREGGWCRGVFLYAFGNHQDYMLLTKFFYLLRKYFTNPEYPPLKVYFLWESTIYSFYHICIILLQTNWQEREYLKVYYIHHESRLQISFMTWFSKVFSFLIQTIFEGKMADFLCFVSRFCVSSLPVLHWNTSAVSNVTDKVKKEISHSSSM